MAAGAEIATISVLGFKSLAAVRNLPLGRVNVLIGANGSGKSNLLGMFPFLREAARGRLASYAAIHGGADRLLHFGRRRTSRIEVEIAFSRPFDERYRVVAVPTETDELTPDREETLRETLVRSFDESAIASLIARFQSHHFHDTSATSPLKSSPALHDNQFLRNDGANLASVLYYLRERQTGTYEYIRDIIRQVAPFFDDFELHPTKLSPDTIRLEWRHSRSDHYFDVSALSDGTLRFITLCVLLLLPDDMKPPIIIVDEPELGLHPYAIDLLAALIRKAAVDTQVILSTQSPALLDHFDATEVIIADLIDGATRLERPDPKRLAKWLKRYTLGELWEKNELGGTPGEY